MGALAASRQSRPATRVIGRFDAGLEDETRSQREADQGDRRAFNPCVQPPDDLAQIFAAARVVDLPCKPESIARAAQVDPHDADAQAQQPLADADHVVRIGTTRQPVHQNGGRHRRLPARREPIPERAAGRRRATQPGAMRREASGARPHVSPQDRLRALPSTAGAARSRERPFHHTAGSSRPR